MKSIMGRCGTTRGGVVRGAVWHDLGRCGTTRRVRGKDREKERQGDQERK